MAASVKGLWDISQDGQKAQKYALGVDPTFPTSVNLRSTTPHSVSSTATIPGIWPSDKTGFVHRVIFSEQWRDNGDLYYYSGFSILHNLLEGTHSFTGSFPSIADVKFVRAIEIMESGGVKFTPPDPPLPDTITLELLLGYLNSISFNIETTETTRTYIRALGEYVTQYKRRISVADYSVDPISLVLTRSTVKGNGKAGIRDPIEISDFCTTSYTRTGYYTPSDDAWIGVRSDSDVPIVHVADGDYSFNDLVTSLGLTKLTPISPPYSQVNNYEFYWELGTRLEYSS